MKNTFFKSLRLSRALKNGTRSMAAASVLGAICFPVGNLWADTQFRLQTVSEARVITEGYVQSVEDWIEAAEAHRSVVDPKHNGHRDPEVWIAHVGTLLFDDRDGDGYFSGFSLSIDADIEWGHTDIYLSIYLQEQGTNQQHFHTSSVFTIYGNSISDEYGIEVELLENYAANHYDLQIDIHDAHTYAVLDSVGAHEQSNLHALPLESELAGPVHHDAHVEEHVGAGGPLFLLSLMGCLGWLRVRNSA
ncbi:MAG: choice-of-anchor H family protein [Gammaproteobacteria bacterium]|nr:choice-of-anchor H family protein [Gammaproteobacteria bacterium]